ncbi:hypothetical protein [Thalassobellus citreus]|uniref:hypothetical protein n=1 Tax=Thalassobellus citreus TaxID=3367752 RepID=UPI0037BDB0E0
MKEKLKDKIGNVIIDKANDLDNNYIDRIEAMKKMGKYAALTALGTFIMLSPKKSQAQSLPPP